VTVELIYLREFQQCPIFSLFRFYEVRVRRHPTDVFVGRENRTDEHFFAGMGRSEMDFDREFPSVLVKPVETGISNSGSMEFNSAKTK